MNIWRLKGARQASFGIDETNEITQPDQWEWLLTIKESFGEYGLSREIGMKVEIVATLPDTATRQEQFDALAEWEEIGMTWAEQHEALLAKYPDPDDWTTDDYKELKQP